MEVTEFDVEVRQVQLLSRKRRRVLWSQSKDRAKGLPAVEESRVLPLT